MQVNNVYNPTKYIYSYEDDWKFINVEELIKTNNPIN